uniref:Uncharacterized protein n=1 Tax=Anguilla anguilla TaxID=7936 RepID=A0A0E9RI94_ANGAN
MSFITGVPLSNFWRPGLALAKHGKRRSADLGSARAMCIITFPITRQKGSTDPG